MYIGDEQGLFTAPEMSPEPDAPIASQTWSHAVIRIGPRNALEMGHLGAFIIRPIAAPVTDKAALSSDPEGSEDAIAEGDGTSGREEGRLSQQRIVMRTGSHGWN